MKCSIFLCLLVLFLTSCYHYTPPPSEYLGTEFNPKKTVPTDQMLDKAKKLTVPLAKKITIMNNQSFQSAFHSVNAAKMRYYQSLGAYAPQITMGSSAAGKADWNTGMIRPPMGIAGRETAFMSSANLTATWLLFDGFARYLNVQIAQAGFKKEKAVEMRVRCMLKRSVAYAFFDLQYAREIIRIQKENQEFQTKLYKIVTPEYRKGKRPEDESLNFLIFSDLAKTARLAAVNQAANANYAMSQLMGYSRGELPKKLEIPSSPQQLERMYYSDENCIDIALQNNPDMHIMRQMLAIANYGRWKSYSSFLPTVYADFGYVNSRYAANYNDYRTSYSAYTGNQLGYGLRAELLIFNGLARYNMIREMQALLASSQFNMAQTYLDVINSIKAAYSSCDYAYRQFQIYREIVPKAKLQRDLVLERYLKYHASVDRMDKVQEYYVNTRIQQAALANEYNKAIAQLEALMMIDIFTD